LIYSSITNGRNTFVWWNLWHPNGVLIDKYIWHRVVYDSCISIQAKLYEVVNGFDLGWPPTGSESLVQIFQAVLCGSVV